MGKGKSSRAGIDKREKLHGGFQQNVSERSQRREGAIGNGDERDLFFPKDLS